MKIVKILVGIISLILLIVIILVQTGMVAECKVCASEGRGCAKYEEKMQDRKMKAVNPLSEVNEGDATLKIPTGTCICGHNPSDHFHFEVK